QMPACPVSARFPRAHDTLLEKRKNPRRGIAADCGGPYSLAIVNLSIRCRDRMSFPTPNARPIADLSLVGRARRRCPVIPGVDCGQRPHNLHADTELPTCVPSDDGSREDSVHERSSRERRTSIVRGAKKVQRENSRLTR